MTNFLLDKSIFSRLLNLNPQWGKGRCVLIYLLQKRELALKKFKASKERKKHPITLAIYFKLSSVICHWREGGSLHHPQINLPIRFLGGGDDGEDTLQGRLAVR